MFLAKNQHTQRGKLLQTLICHYVDIVPSCQKLDIVIKNKVFQKLKVCPLKTVLLQSYPYMKKTHTIFLQRKSDLNVRFWIFLTARHKIYVYSQNIIISLEGIDFLPNICISCIALLETWQPILPYYEEGKNTYSSVNSSTSTNSSRFVDYSVYVEDLEKTEIIGLIQQRQIPVKSDLPVTHISVMKNALR